MSASQGISPRLELTFTAIPPAPGEPKSQYVQVRLVWDAEIYLDAALALESAPAMVGAMFESITKRYCESVAR
jgi:hypothetical protein